MSGFFPRHFWPVAIYTTDVSITPATILAAFIINSLGKMTVPTDGESWPLYSPHMPDGDNVETNCGVVHDTLGVNDVRSISSGVVSEHPGVQIRIRTNDYNAGFAKIEDIALALDVVANETFTIGSESYKIHNVSRASPITSLGVEPGTKRRMFFTVNYLLTLKKL